MVVGVACNIAIFIAGNLSRNSTKGIPDGISFPLLVWRPCYLIASDSSASGVVSCRNTDLAVAKPHKKSLGRDAVDIVAGA